MQTRKLAEPLLVTHLIPEMRAELISVLRTLPDDAWDRATACGDWSVRDVALHILGDDIGLLSNLRDHDGQYHEIDGWAELVTVINAQNQAWVAATRRISRKLIIDLLRFTGLEVYDLFRSIDPHSMGGPVGWAGEDPDPMWLHIARELTEYWTHHQHICEALAITSLQDARFIGPVLATFVHALPHTLKDVEAPVDTLVQFIVTGEGGGEWHVVRAVDGWKLYTATNLVATSTVSLDADTAWRLFTKNRPVEQLREQITLTGDADLGERVLATVAIIA